MTNVQRVLPREVPLGGLRAMRVRRTLPARERSGVGAWCFLDHYGPDLVADSGGMKVAPHPHTGLQTVSWLFSGEIEHRDSAGHHAEVRPGEVNLMTAGRGISHSEVSTAGTRALHGAQLWVALPDADRFTDPGFTHHIPTAVTGEGWIGKVLVGSLLGDSSPVPTFTPLVGAELTLDPGARLEVAVEPGFEYAVLVDSGVAIVAGTEVGEHVLAYLEPGARSLGLTAPTVTTRLLLLGGEPFEESLVMWWNFVGRSHEEIAGFRDEWQRQIHETGELVTAGHQVQPGLFGVVSDRLAPIPAPPLPGVRLKPRR